LRVDLVREEAADEVDDSMGRGIAAEQFVELVIGVALTVTPVPPPQSGAHAQMWSFVSARGNSQAVGVARVGGGEDVA
jgi:hypothetical protein